MFRRIILTTASAVLLSACATNTAPTSSLKTFNAVLEQDGTRTSLGSDLSVRWTEGDAITVFSGQPSGTTFEMASISDNGMTASFQGEIPSSSIYYAIYPAQEKATIFGDNATICASIPSVQPATAGSFADNVNLSISRTDSDQLYFKNVGGLLGFTANGTDIVSAMLSADEKDGGALSGDCYFGYSGDDLLIFPSEEYGRKNVTLEGAIKSGDKYYFVVYPGTYQNLKLVFTNSKGEVAEFTTDNELTVGRATCTNIGSFNISADRWRTLNPSIEAPDELEIGAEGEEDGSFNVTLNDADDWNFSVKYSGCVVSARYDAEYYEVNYVVKPNTTTSDKTGSIILALTKSGQETIEHVVAVTQKGQKEIIVADEYYKKVNSTLANWEGTYIIVSESESIAATKLSGTWLQGDDVTISDGKVERTEVTQSTMEVKIAALGGGYTIRLADGNYLGSTNANNGIKVASSVTSADKDFIWTLSYDGLVKIALSGSTERHLRYNPSGGFRTYTGVTGDQATLYRYGSSSGGVESPEIVTVSSVTEKGLNSARVSATFKNAAGMTAAGFKYGTSQTSLTSTVNATLPTSDAGTFSAVIGGLAKGTMCYFQAFVTVAGTTYVGSVYSFRTLTDAETEGIKADYGWFELPAQKDLDRNGIDDQNKDYYYSHTMRADAPKIRNFSSCYSKSKIHPVWVAAPMHNCYKGQSGRNDSYKADPNISCTQAGKWSGYTRGHMLGSSDRTISKETNRQVFYYSNIGAQLQTGFNTGGGSWNNLESMVDGQWCSDTLYQVIGCIFDTFTDRYGRTVYPTTMDGSQIPTAYYKVLLRTKKGNTGKRVDNCDATELKCAAFILTHRANASHQPSSQDMYTLEELEDLTGLTFFVNVPNAPKGTAVASEWGL